MERMEVRTTHKEADVIVVQQAIHLASLGKQVLLPACPALNSALVEVMITAGMSIP